ncbi:MAG: DUF3794 domain-containing protein [Clostridia bacterium]
MELNLVKEEISANETVYNGSLELGVESDYVLPDYLPDINRILKCTINGRITSKQFFGDKATIDGYSLIKLVYLSDNLKAIKIAQIRIPFSKNYETKTKDESLFIEAQCLTDYCNCRVINQRRVDIRGAISIFIRLSHQKINSIITDVAGKDIQLNKNLISSLKTIAIQSKQFTLTDEIDFNEDDSDIAEIINISAVEKLEDVKIITNKVILKGDVKIKAFCQKEDDDKIDYTYVNRTIPFSQIIDLDGINEDSFVNVKVEIIGADGEIINESAKTAEGAEFNVTILITIEGYKKSEDFIITDAYSIKYPCNFKSEQIPLQQNVASLDEQISFRDEFNLEEEQIYQVFETSSEIIDFKTEINDGIMLFKGDLLYQIIGQNTSNEIVLIEKNGTFEFKKQISNNLTEDIVFDGQVKFNEIPEYNLSEQSITIKGQIELSGLVLGKTYVDGITEIEVDEDNPKQLKSNAALIIYYADKNENIWDIAKKYNTNPEKIIEDNELDSKQTTEKTMLLVQSEM